MNTTAVQMPFAALDLESADGARAAISSHGAHLLSWTPRRGGERLYLSGKAQAGPGQTIRGGVPVIFPQFAAEGPLPKHGFARTLPWTLLSQERRDDGAAAARYGLADSADTLTLWPHAFAAELEVVVRGDTLAISLRVHNTGTAAFDFTAALHSYLRVDDIDQLRIEGLHGLLYRDTACAGVQRREQQAQLGIAGEVDRIYLDAPPQLMLRDTCRSLVIRQSGFVDTVIWNPGAAKAAALADLDAGGWRRMLCIEAATIGRPVHLTPGSTWRGNQTLEAK